MNQFMQRKQMWKCHMKWNAGMQRHPLNIWWRRVEFGSQRRLMEKTGVCVYSFDPDVSYLTSSCVTSVHLRPVKAAVTWRGRGANTAAPSTKKGGKVSRANFFQGIEAVDISNIKPFKHWRMWRTVPWHVLYVHIVFIDDKFGFVSFKVIKLASFKSGNLSDLYRPVVVLAPVTKKKQSFLFIFPRSSHLHAVTFCTFTFSEVKDFFIFSRLARYCKFGASTWSLARLQTTERRCFWLLVSTQPHETTKRRRRHF